MRSLINRRGTTRRPENRPELRHVGCYDCMNDLKFAFRQLLKNSGFTAVAVLTLVFGLLERRKGVQ